MTGRMAGLALAALIAGALSGCDRSPQSADGATKAGDPGTAAATGTGAMADTGHDNTSADIGGSGDVAQPGAPKSAGGATSPKNQ